MNFGHEGARGVDRLKLACGGLGMNLRRYPMRRKHHAGTLGHLVRLVDEDRPTLGERLHDEPVVHDLLADVHRGAVVLDRLLDGDDRTVDARAVAARGSQQHPLRRRAVASLHRGVVTGVAPHGGGSGGPGREGLGHPASLGDRPRRGPVRTWRACVTPVPDDGGVTDAPLPSSAAPDGPLPARALDTTAERPWPVRLLSAKIAEYIDKMSPVWIEGQVVQLNRRPGAGMAFLTLRDTDADVSLPVTLYAKVLAGQTTPLAEGVHVVVHAKPTFWKGRGSFQMQAEEIRALGGTFQTAVAKDTTYLVAAGKVGSSKLKKAEAYGTAIINEQELQELLGE